jgi:hypothetical protein
MISKVIPRELLQDGQMSLLFQFPDAVRPKDLSEGSESTVLAMKLLQFQADLITAAGSPDY